MERILITGASGFTGSKLVKLLQNKNYDNCKVFLTDVTEDLSHQNLPLYCLLSRTLKNTKMSQQKYLEYQFL